MANEWVSVKKRLPGIYQPTLLCFKDSWNVVSGFYAGDGKWWEHTATENNKEITGAKPLWWQPAPESKLRADYHSQLTAPPKENKCKKS